MNLTTARNQDVSIVRVNETRLMYPILGEFASTITSLIGSGERKLHNSCIRPETLLP